MGEHIEATANICLDKDVFKEPYLLSIFLSVWITFYTKIYGVPSEIVFYIYFLICNKTKNKQLPISKLLALNFSF